MDVKYIFFFIALVASTLALPFDEAQLENNELLFPNDPPPRVIGGILAAEGSHPHMVALTTGRLLTSLLCGGSLISSRTVLTAAHCITPVFSLGSLSSSLRGTVGTNRWNSGGLTFRFSRNVTHPHYVANIIKNDIGLLITATNIASTGRINVVPMSFDFVGAHVLVRAAGWGRTRVGGSTSRNLMELSMTTIDGNVCANQVATVAASANMRAPAVDPALEICTFYARGHGMCHGDSGSALVMSLTGQQVGVVSWGIPCAIGGPDMFTRLSAYESFIFDNIVYV